jgi:cyclophilin family peptidyl-prolyl cis-trans isomerase
VVFDERAPASASYFLYDVRGGLYDGSTFFRIVTLSNQRTERWR